MGGVNWHIVAPVTMVGFLIVARFVVMPAMQYGIQGAAVAEMERRNGTEWRSAAGVPQRSAERAKPESGLSTLSWVLGFGGMLAVGGGVTAYFVLDRGEDDEPEFNP